MKRISLTAFFLLLILFAWAQNGKVYPRTDIKKGVLKNGLTYYVYNNPASKGKVNFYLVQNVGAILEEDSQAGLAHFLEHMCFNGTRNFPGNTIMEKFSQKGLKHSINAYTGVDQTVYHLTNIPANDRAFCDECLLILYDWCNNVTLAHDKVEAERPVIIEEMRTRNVLNFRIKEQIAPAVYNNSKYTKRNIIGPAEVINNFKREELIEFYNTWYRTDLQAVVVIGDIDAIETEEKIRNLFSTLPKQQNPQERYHITIPDNKETYYTEVKDKEIKGSSLRILYRHEFSESIEENFMGAMINGLLKKRIAKLLKDDKDKEKNKEEIFNGCSIGFAPMVYGYGNYTIVVEYKDGKAESAINRALGMNKDILQNGFTQEEFDNIKSKMLTSLRNLKNAKGRMHNKYYFEQIKKNFISNVDILDAGSNLKAFEKLLKNLTLEDITTRLNEWYSGPNKSITVLGGLEDELLTKQQVLDFEANCEAIKIVPDKEDEEEKEFNEDSLLSKELEGSKVVKTEKLSDFNAEKWTLENGATVIYKECNLNPEMVNIYGTSPGGLSSQNGKDLINASAFSSFVPAMGIKGYSKEEFENLLKTKQIKCFPKLTQRDEEFYLMCKYANLETAFQILYNAFENPEIYKDKFDEIYTKLGEQLKKVKITHKTQLKDSIGLMRYGAEKFIKVDSNWYNSISPEGISKVYKDRFQDAGNFTFYIVGGIGKGKAKKLAQQYIGSLSSTGRNEELTLLANKLPQGRTKRTYAFDIPGNQAGVIYNMEMPADNNFKDKLCFSMIKSYLQEQLHDEIREKERGTYGVHVKNKLERYSTRNCNFNITFECAPERAEELDNILHETLAALCERGISQADFEIVKKKFDKPQRPPKKNNIYYVNMLKELVEMGTNNAEDDFYKKQLDSIDREYMNKMLKELIEKSAILDIVYVPDVE